MAPSQRVAFRAVPPLGEMIETRRIFPDIRGDALVGDPDESPNLANPGTVAARDLYVFYRLLEAERAEAMAQLTTNQVVMILDAVNGLLPDFRFITDAAAMLADDVRDAFDDDEADQGLSPERAALADLIASWPRLRALAVLEAALAWWNHPKHAEDTDAALAAVGLTRSERRRRRPAGEQ